MRFTQAPGGTGGTWVMLWINLVQQGGDQRLWEIKKKGIAPGGSWACSLL